jgi:hypothetical protein
MAPNSSSSSSPSVNPPDRGVAFRVSIRIRKCPKSLGGVRNRTVKR